MKWWQWISNAMAVICIGLTIILLFPFIVLFAMVTAAIGDKK